MWQWPCFGISLLELTWFSTAGLSCFLCREVTCSYRNQNLVKSCNLNCSHHSTNCFYHHIQHKKLVHLHMFIRKLRLNWLSIQFYIHIDDLIQQPSNLRYHRIHILQSHQRVFVHWYNPKENYHKWQIQRFVVEGIHMTCFQQDRNLCRITHSKMMVMYRMFYILKDIIGKLMVEINQDSMFWCIHRRPMLWVW